MILAQDATGLIAEKSNAPLGDAHELIVRGVLMRLGFTVGTMDLSSGASDLFVEVYRDHRNLPSEHEIIKVQVKTASGNLPLAVAGRGGVDREYKSSEKQYKYTREHTDLIIGVETSGLDLFFMPYMFFEQYGQSVSLRKIEILRNKYQLLLNWREDYMTEEIEPHLG